MNDKIIVHIDPELEELIPGYLENRQRDLLAIRAALDGGDFEAIERLAHVMKGSGGGYGFDAITEIGGRMEEAARTNNAAQIAKGLDKLSDYLKRVEVVYG